MNSLQRRSTVVLGMLAVFLLMSAFVLELRGDGARAETEAAVVAAQEDEFTHTLHFPWSLLPWVSANIATEDSLNAAGLLGVVTAIWGWDNEAQAWQGFFPDFIDTPGANDLLEFRWGQAYWVAINDDDGAAWPVTLVDGLPPPPPPPPAPEACPEPLALSAGATEYTSVSVDLTGDGLDDELATYHLPSIDQWRLRITFGAGGGFDEAILLNGLFEARPVSGFDVNGDGRKEAFVTVGLGITQIWHGLYVISDCTATRVTHEGVAASFPVGAGVRRGWMLQCRPPGLWAALIEVGGDPTQTAPRPFEVWRQPYTLEGTELIAGETEHLTGDEARAVAHEPLFDCGVEFGAPP